MIGGRMVVGADNLDLDREADVGRRERDERIAQAEAERREAQPPLSPDAPLLAAVWRPIKKADRAYKRGEAIDLGRYWWPRTRLATMATSGRIPTTQKL